MAGAGFRALILDRDGVINIDRGYIYRVEDCEFIPAIFKLVQAAKLRGYKIIVVTNQSGIARGLYTEEDYYKVRNYIHDRFAKRCCAIDAEYFCPYHVDGQGDYKKDSFDRKPNPGMILRAAQEHGLNLKRSILVGNQLSDIEAGRRAGVGRKFLVDWRTVGLVGRFLGWYR